MKRDDVRSVRIVFTEDGNAEVRCSVHGPTRDRRETHTAIVNMQIARLLRVDDPAHVIAIAAAGYYRKALGL